MPRAVATGPRRPGAQIARVVVPFLIAGLLFLLGLTIAAVLVVVAACVLLVLTVFAPHAARRVEHVFERVGHWVGHGLTIVLLGIVDLLVFTPIAFVMWVFRYDPLAPGVRRDAASFWHAHNVRSLPGKPFADERSLFVPAGAVGYQRSRPVLRVATAIGVVALLLLADLGGGWLYDEVARSTRGTAAVAADDTYDAATQPAFRDAPWARDLLQEQTELPGVRDPYLGYRIGDMTGRYTNFVNGARVSYEPATSDKKLVVWFFGASALFGAGQRDGYTIACRSSPASPSRRGSRWRSATSVVPRRRRGRSSNSSSSSSVTARSPTSSCSTTASTISTPSSTSCCRRCRSTSSTRVPRASRRPRPRSRSRPTRTRSRAPRPSRPRRPRPTLRRPDSTPWSTWYWDQAASHRVYDAIDELLNGSSAPKTQFLKGIDQKPTGDATANDQIVQAARTPSRSRRGRRSWPRRSRRARAPRRRSTGSRSCTRRSCCPKSRPTRSSTATTRRGRVPAMAEVRKLLKKTPYTDIGTAVDGATEPVLWDFVHTNEAGARLSAQAIFDNLRPRLQQRLAKSS